jgi:hypothetical protein
MSRLPITPEGAAGQAVSRSPEGCKAFPLASANKCSFFGGARPFRDLLFQGLQHSRWEDAKRGIAGIGVNSYARASTGHSDHTCFGTFPVLVNTKRIIVCPKSAQPLELFAEVQ